MSVSPNRASSLLAKDLQWHSEKPCQRGLRATAATLALVGRVWAGGPPHCYHRYLGPPDLPRPRVCAVSYFNTVPLVWGMLHGPQRDVFELTFAIPSVCAARVRDGESDIGIVPVATLLEQDLAIFRGTGIASRSAVRTILLISKRPFAEIGVLAGDRGSRTSVELARIITPHNHGRQTGLIST